MNIHLIGDCHSHFGWRGIGTYIDIDRHKILDIPPFEELHFNGPRSMSMAGFGVRKLETVDITTKYYRATPSDVNDPKYIEENYPVYRDYNIKEGDVVIFSVGNSDCTSYFPLPEHSNVWTELIDESVFHYFEAIRANAEKINNLHIMVYNIIPVLVDPDTAFPGSFEYRKIITLYCNNKIKEYCEKYNYIFFDVYDKYCNEEGYLNQELAYTTHINNPVYLIEFLISLGKLFAQ